MKRHPCLLLVTCFNLTLMLGMVGCASQSHFENPVAVMANSKNPIDRMAAARQSELTHANDPDRIAALNKMLWEFGHGDDERRYAIDQLLVNDPQNFRKILARRIVMIKNPLTVQYICELVTKNHWTDFTPALVRSYARPMLIKDEPERPEAAALKTLHPDTPIEQIVFNVFADTHDQSSIHEQTAAWDLLWKLANRQQITALLLAAPSDNPMVADLQASLRDLHCLPEHREGYLRLAWLRNPERKAYWAKAKAAVAKLNESQKDGLELRHIPIIVQLDDQTLAMTRQAFIDKISKLMDAQKHYLRSPSLAGPKAELLQRFAQAIDRLVWADMATIDLLYTSVQSSAMIQTLFKQADKDYIDTSTEHGGVITVADGVVNATRFSALYTQGDLKFIPTDEMIQSLYTNLAHYHFHAHREHNRDFAGPSKGDMRMINQLETHALVFTFIDKDTLNVDYYQPNGAVVDIGVIRR